MNAYERMIEVMRRQGKKTSGPAPMLGPYLTSRRNNLLSYRAALWRGTDRIGP